jgi:AmmeMemoRadiSam system protein A
MLKQTAWNGAEAGVKKDTTAKVLYMPRQLGKEYATFVTLKKDGHLRGCMGHTISTKSLLSSVEETGRMAAVKDPRFSPVTENELPELSIEVTILSRFKKVFDINDIEVGKDGLVLRLGYNSGLFLPQVAPENNWDRETFLKQLGRKAGLDYNAYKTPNVEIYKFLAIIID